MLSRSASCRSATTGATRLHSWQATHPRTKIASWPSNAGVSIAPHNTWTKQIARNRLNC